MFRGKYLATLDRLRRTGALHFAGQSAPLGQSLPWQQLLAALRCRHWVVYAKPPFGGPEHVLKYLSRYTHRVAIANHRLVFVGDGIVRFTWKDYADHCAHREMTLQAEEFLRRFLLHVVPRRFVRIRHYGLLANRHRAQKLERCRHLLGVKSISPPQDSMSSTDADTPDDTADGATDVLPAPCPHCGARMRIVEILLPAPWDTS